MSGTGRPGHGHFLGKVISNSAGKVEIQAEEKDVEYLEEGKTYVFDANPTGRDSAGDQDAGSQQSG